MDILSITNKSSVSADAKVYTKDGNDFVTTTFDALYKNSSAKTNIEQSVSDANARIDTTNNIVAELDNYARAKGSGIVLQSQGEMVTVNDSSDDYMVNLKPYGKSEQDSTTGAQLLKYDAWKTVGVSRGTAVFENNGVTITATDNDACTNSAPGYIPEECYIEASEGETINLSWEEDTNTSGLVYIFGDGANDSMVTVNNSTAKKLSYTVPSGITFVTFRFGVAVAGNTISYKNIMINKGSTALPWEPYTNGASPNPDYPQEIRSTVISEMRSCGKNLLKNTATSQTLLGLNIAMNDNGSVSIKGTPTALVLILLGQTEMLGGSSYIISGGRSSAMQLSLRDSSHNVVYAGDIGNGALYTPTENTTGYLFIRIDVNAGAIDTTIYPMIRKAEITDATYEPYTETVATLSEPITLYGIPTDSGGNFTDSNGQQWISDYIDVTKGKVVRCVNTEVFDGSTDENWHIQNGDRNFFTIDTSQHALSGTKLLCNIAPSGSVSVYNEELGVYIVDAHILRYRYEINNNLTVDDVREHLAQHNMTIYYPLATPTEEDLPTADIVALKNLKTFYSVTHVMNDSEVKGEMVLSYNADTKMYIDNKFAELAAQLV